MDLPREIEKIYIAYFNRPADNAGLAFWLNQINSGKASLSDITATFATTPEYLGLFAGKSSTAVVETIYKNLFGRVPEPDGLKFWADGLNSGKFGVGTVAYTTLVSAQSTDKTIIENKAAAALSFTSYLGSHKADSIYTGTLVDKAREWLAKIDATPGSVTSAETGIAQVVTGGPTGPVAPTEPAKTFTFTLGWDPSKPPPTGIDWSKMPTTPLETYFPPHKIGTFTLGHDKLNIVDISGNKVNIAAPTLFYQHGAHTGGEGMNYQFSIYAALGGAHNGGKTQTLAALKAGETVLISSLDAAGQKKTYLFIDDGSNVGTGGGMDNGPGSATWKLDGDVIIDITNLVGLKTSADDLTVLGSFFA